MLKKFAVVTICIAFLCGNAMAQDAKTVIANAQKASGDLKSITYSGTAKDVAFQQCGANAAEPNCKGTHDPMRPITNYVRVIDLTAPTSRQPEGRTILRVAAQRRRRLEHFFLKSRPSKRMSRSHGPAPWSFTSRPGVS